MRMLNDAPWAYASSPEHDPALDPERLTGELSGEHSAILAIEGPDASRELIASAGIVRVSQPKSAHRARLWGVFVDPAHRGGGLGRAVVSAAVELARSWRGVDFVDLGVSENSPAAHALYETLGFQAWGREPESLQCGGRRYDEIFMTLRL
jgi:RimJ/RimL family protein N-acetyltransferase